MSTLEQDAIHQRISAACRSRGSPLLAYKSEWLGYLPYGQYHWVEVAGEEISRAFPTGWQYSDLQALIDKGALECLAEFRQDAESDDVEIQLRLLRAYGTPSQA